MAATTAELVIELEQMRAREIRIRAELRRRDEVARQELARVLDSKEAR